MAIPVLVHESVSIKINQMGAVTSDGGSKCSRMECCVFLYVLNVYPGGTASQHTHRGISSDS